MTTNELKAEFRIMFEDLATSGSKGLDDYEMSVCLTQGQELVIQGLLQSKDFTSLRPVLSTTKGTKEAMPISLFKEGIRFKLPSETVGVVERALFGSIDSIDKIIGVELIEAGRLSQLYKAAYKYPPKNLAYVMVEEDAETVFPPLNFTIKDYICSCVAYPGPITIGTQFVNGETLTDNPPTLYAPLHRKIVQQAVQFAISVYIGQPEKQVGNGSSGNK